MVGALGNHQVKWCIFLQNDFDESQLLHCTKYSMKLVTKRKQVDYFYLVNRYRDKDVIMVRVRVQIMGNGKELIDDIVNVPVL